MARGSAFGPMDGADGADGPDGTEGLRRPLAVASHARDGARTR